MTGAAPISDGSCPARRGARFRSGARFRWRACRRRRAWRARRGFANGRACGRCGCRGRSRRPRRRGPASGMITADWMCCRMIDDLPEKRGSSMALSVSTGLPLAKASSSSEDEISASARGSPCPVWRWAATSSSPFALRSRISAVSARMISAQTASTASSTSASGRSSNSFCPTASTCSVVRMPEAGSGPSRWRMHDRAQLSACEQQPFLQHGADAFETPSRTRGAVQQHDAPRMAR